MQTEVQDMLIKNNLLWKCNSNCWAHVFWISEEEKICNSYWWHIEQLSNLGYSFVFVLESSCLSEEHPYCIEMKKPITLSEINIFGLKSLIKIS